MPTNPPSLDSQNEPKPHERQQLNDLHVALQQLGVEEPKDLVVVALSPTESVVGQAESVTGLGEKASIMESNGFVAIRNPVRITRVTMVDRNSGQVRVEMRFSDYDFVQAGVVEFRGNACFYLVWLDYQSQLLYCGNLAGFLDGRRRHRLRQDSGIELAEASALKRIDEMTKKKE